MNESNLLVSLKNGSLEGIFDFGVFFNISKIRIFLLLYCQQAKMKRNSNWDCKSEFQKRNFSPTSTANLFEVNQNFPLILAKSNDTILTVFPPPNIKLAIISFPQIKEIVPLFSMHIF